MQQNGFPIGYFYILSRLNGFALDLRGDPDQAAPRTKIVMAKKKTESPERDSQLWIHQSGFLTNKASGLVLDINTAESFVAIFTGEKRLYLDGMKEQQAADDQRFGYKDGYIYQLADPKMVVDIRHEDPKEDARVMIYRRKDKEGDVLENQLWDLELGDPPRQVDSDDEDEDDSKRARMRSWFGNWCAWGDKKKDLLKEKDLNDAHDKVYNKKKSHASYELLAGAVAFEAVNLWEKKQQQEGKEVDHKLAKQLVASFAAKELVKLLSERGEDEDDSDDKPSAKKKMLTKMAVIAATNFFESRHGS